MSYLPQCLKQPRTYQAARVRKFVFELSEVAVEFVQFT